jgi:transposase InsO family protein
MRYRFIDAEKVNYPIRLMCRVLRVSPSGYYAWQVREPSRRAIENESLLVSIRAVHTKSKRRYGSPRVHQELAAQGRRTSLKRVARLMRQNGLRAVGKRRFRVTTQSGHTRRIAPNLLAREFHAPRPDCVWVGDISYVLTMEGWLYVAVLIDLYSRRVVGWAIGDRITDDLTIGALQMAITRRNPRPGLIVHSDRGSQYASAEYLRLLAARGFRASMSRRGDCWDNAVAESFFATLKRELEIDWWRYPRSSARHWLIDYIESFYNEERRHSSIAYKSPAQFERHFVRRSRRGQ